MKRLLLCILALFALPASAAETGSYPNAQPLNGTERILADQGPLNTVNITPVQISSYLVSSNAINQMLPQPFVSGECLSNNGTSPLWISCGIGSGTVTSVGLTVPGGFSVTGSPITSSGTFAITTSLSGLISGTGTGFTQATSASVISLWTGTCNSTTYLRADGTCQTGGGGGGGTVTSVGLTAPAWFTVSGSPITTTGTIGIAAASETGNTVLAAPNGTAGTPSFRALVSADIPTTLNSLTSASSLATVGTIGTGIWQGTLIAPTYGGTGEAGTITGIPKANGTGAFTAAAYSDVTGLWSGTCSATTFLRGDGSCQTPAGGGTVTSVALTEPSMFSVSGSPITGGGTLAVTFATGQTANEFLATPNGTTGAVGLRAIVAADLPASITSSTTGNAATATALAAVPTQCSTGNVSTGIAANGNANCTTAGAGTVTTTGSPASGQLPEFTGSTSITGITASANTIVGNSGSGLAALTPSQAIGVLNSGAANNQTGTTYTLALTDANGEVTMSNAAANTLTIPPQPIVAPTQSAPSTSTTGGTLAAGTYYYVVTALTSSGETTASNEQSITTTGTTSENTISWGAVTGASGYRVYRGTAAGAENVYYAPGNVTSYVDTGSAGTSASPPASNTSGVAFPIGTIFTVEQVGTGTTSVALGTSVSVQWGGPITYASLGGQYGYEQFQQTASNVWQLVAQNLGNAKFTLTGTCSTAASTAGGAQGGTITAPATGTVASCTDIVTPGGGLTAATMWLGQECDQSQLAVPCWTPSSEGTTTVTFTRPAAVAVNDVLTLRTWPN